MDVPPATVIDVTPPRGLTASYLDLPGERVLRTPVATMHIQRSVRVPRDRYLWRTHKKVSLGELASRVDPQISQPTAAADSITIQASIDKDGYISNVKPLYGSFALLPNVAKAVREWRYEPTYVDNKAVDTQAKIEIDFHQPATRPVKP